MGVDEKIEKLDVCFNAGEFGIVDELNSAPMMERKMNALLMHKMEDNSRPKKPGSMITATQNPSTMAGRTNASNAQKRRTTLFPLPEYPDEERKILLLAAGVEEKHALCMIEAANITNATTRGLLNVAEQWKKIISRRHEIHIEIPKESKISVLNNQTESIISKKSSQVYEPLVNTVEDKIILSTLESDIDKTIKYYSGLINSQSGLFFDSNNIVIFKNKIYILNTAALVLKGDEKVETLDQIIHLEKYNGWDSDEVLKNLIDRVKKVTSKTHHQKTNRRDM